MSLSAWRDLGSLERELALYAALARLGVQISFVSWGGAEDEALVTHVPGARVLWNRWRLPRRLYELALPLLFAPTFRRAHVVKTNQTNGADLGWAVARLWGARLVVRSGYLWSLNAERAGGRHCRQARLARLVEGFTYPRANRVVVTTSAMAADVHARFPAARVDVLPNFVDTDLFAPAPAEADSDILFIGRLSPEKNVAALLEAAERLKLTVTIVGKGPEENSLRARFGDGGGRLRWLGKVDHRNLPRLMRQSRIFALPSLYEGHPKAAIEAMACGMVVLGSDVPGVRDTIVHGESGWLAGTSADSLAQALQHLLGDSNLRARLSAGARSQAEARYSLARLAERERALYDELLR